MGDGGEIIGVLQTAHWRYFVLTIPVGGLEMLVLIVTK